MFNTFPCIHVPAVVPQHMLPMPCLPFNKLPCLQVLLRWALVSSAAVLLAACLLPCLVSISILVADGVTMDGTLPSCALMVTACAACIATDQAGQKVVVSSMGELSLPPSPVCQPSCHNKGLCSAVKRCKEKKKEHCLCGVD